jgi:peptidoglycan/LPS O-acetylase OafA/YrhL
MAAVSPTSASTEHLGHLARRSDRVHFPLLEGLRAFAALAVVAYHFWFVNAGGGVDTFAEKAIRVCGTAGVAVFFVLSGFLLYRPFSGAARGHHARPATVAFYQRRAARILPAYWIAFAVGALWIGLEGVTRSNAPIYAALLQDYTDATRYGGIVAAWSLGIEATFYVLLPLGALVLAFGARMSRCGEALLLACAGLVPLLLEAARPGTPETILTHLDWFAAGMLLAALSTSSRVGWLDDGLHRPRATAGIVAVVLAAYLVAMETTGMAREYALAVFGAALVGCGASVRPGVPARRVLGTAPVAWLGLISYGIFLWHYPILVRLSKEGLDGAALLVVALLATVAAAAASYYLVEGPVQRWVRRRGAGRKRGPQVAGDANEAPRARAPAGA